MARPAAILLAAGLSRRMGARNKLLLPWRGTSVIRHVAGQYVAALGGAVTVVTGHEAAAVEAALDDLPVRCIRNPEYAAGRQSSVAAGLAAAPDAEPLLIGLGDQPLLTAAALTALIAAHRATGGARITVPVQGTARGNPIVVPAALRPRLSQTPGQPGCLRFTRENPALVASVPMTDAGFFTDIDTPEAYAALAPDPIEVPRS